jgi:hypothetical protein
MQLSIGARGGCALVVAISSTESQVTIWHMLGCTLVALLTASCLLEDERCGKGQEAFNDRFEGCVCSAGYVPNTDGVGCRACGDHEEARAGSCVCESGYSRSAPNTNCKETTDSGAPPDSGSASTSGARGQDMSCGSSSDCESFDATYCLTLLPPSVCLVQGCATGDHACQPDRDC